MRSIKTELAVKTETAKKYRVEATSILHKIKIKDNEPKEERYHGRADFNTESPVDVKAESPLEAIDTTLRSFDKGFFIANNIHKCKNHKLLYARFLVDENCNAVTTDDDKFFAWAKDEIILYEMRMYLKVYEVNRVF